MSKWIAGLLIFLAALWFLLLRRGWRGRARVAHRRELMAEARGNMHEAMDHNLDAVNAARAADEAGEQAKQRYEHLQGEGRSRLARTLERFSRKVGS